MGPGLLDTAPPELPLDDAAGTAPVLTPRLVPDARNPTDKFQGAIYVYGPLVTEPTPTAGTIGTYKEHSFRAVFYRIANSSPDPRVVFRASFGKVSASPGAGFEGVEAEVSTAVDSVEGMIRYLVHTACLDHTWWANM